MRPIAREYDDGESQRASETGRAVECDFCGLRYARGMVGDDPACSECLSSRMARIRACANRMRRTAPDQQSEEIADEVLDVFDAELEL